MYASNWSVVPEVKKLTTQLQVIIHLSVLKFKGLD